MLFYAILIKLLAGNLYFVPWRIRSADSFWPTFKFILFTKESVFVTFNWNKICLRLSDAYKSALFKLFVSDMLLHTNYIIKGCCGVGLGTSEWLEASL